MKPATDDTKPSANHFFLAQRQCSSCHLKKERIKNLSFRESSNCCQSTIKWNLINALLIIKSWSMKLEFKKTKKKVMKNARHHTTKYLFYQFLLPRANTCICWCVVAQHCHKSALLYSLRTAKVSSALRSPEAITSGKVWCVRYVPWALSDPAVKVR